jgi:hypothetical protein
MKWLIALLFISSAFAKEACYDIENYGEVCVTYQTSAINSEVQVTVYKGQELMETIPTKSSEYFQGGHFCGGKEHDCWTIPGSFQVHASSAKYEVFLSLDRWMTVNSCGRCSSSSVRGKEGKGFNLRVR